MLNPNTVMRIKMSFIIYIIPINSQQQRFVYQINTCIHSGGSINIHMERVNIEDMPLQTALFRP